MGEIKIDVTATLRHAPSTRAEFLVSAKAICRTFYIPELLKWN